MIELVTQAVTFAVGLADKAPWLMWALVVIGGLYVVLMFLQPVVVAIAKLTKTTKDDTFLAKMYDILTDWGPCFAPAAAVFAKKTGFQLPQAGADNTNTQVTQPPQAGADNTNTQATQLPKQE